jgi:MtN3 and saliva related transmembrane protein
MRRCREGAMNPLWINIVGVGAALCSMTSFVPQIIKIVRERDAEGVSLRMYLVTVAGFCLWIGYGALIHSWPVAVSNLVNLALAGTILALKWRLSRSS